MPRCIQELDSSPAPCFLVLGRCQLDFCPVEDYLEKNKINPDKPGFIGALIMHHALHWVCVQSIHNEELSEIERTKLKEGLKRIISSH